LTTGAGLSLAAFTFTAFGEAFLIFFDLSDFLTLEASSLDFETARICSFSSTLTSDFPLGAD
jgi:hypothetical protein